MSRDNTQLHLQGINFHGDSQSNNTNLGLEYLASSEAIFWPRRGTPYETGEPPEFHDIVDCACRKLRRGWSGGISVFVDESATAGRFYDLEVSIWLV